MNQITLDVRLLAESEDVDALIFAFDEGELKVNLNTDSCQIELKEVFSKLIKLGIDNDVTLQLKIDEGYNRGLYKDVCIEYIDELQSELNNVLDKVRREMID